MPTVETYGPTTQVALRPVSGEKQRAADFGGQQIAQGLDSLGQGLGEYARQERLQADRLDEANAKTLDNEYADFERKALYGDGQTPGYLMSQSRSALDARADVEKALNDKAKELRGRATSPQQVRMFDQVLTSRTNQSFDRIATHAANQSAVYHDESSNAQILLTGEDASAAASIGDDKTAAIKMAAGLDLISQRAQEKGWDGNILGIERLKFTNGVHDAVARSLLQTNPHAAQDYLDLHGADMTQASRTALVGPIRAAVTTADASAFASGVMASGAGSLPVAGAGNPVSGQIVTQASSQGVDPGLATVIAMVESGLRPTAKNGQSHGIFQLQDAAWAEMGGTAADRNSPARQVELGVKYVKRTVDRLTVRLGRTPQAWEVYLAHQQGDAGGPALFTAPPEVSAVSVLEGIGVSPKTARASIVGNGGTAQMTAGEFVERWKAKFATKAAQGSAVAAGTPAATMTQPVEPDLPTMRRNAIAAAGGDPQRQKAFVQAAEARYGDWKQDQGIKANAADDALQPYIHGPNAVRSISDIPANIIGALSPQKLGSLQDHFAEGGEFSKKNDVTAQTYLSEMMVENPAAFASEDMTKWAGKLTSDTYGSMLTAQRDARRGTGQFSPITVTTSDVMKSATNVLVRNGLDPKRDKAQIGQLQQVMLDWGNAFVDDHKRRPTPQEINTAMDGYLLQGAVGQGLFAKKVRVFEAGGARYFRLEIPRAAEKQLTDDFKQSKGREPSRQELVTLYRALHAAGKID